MSKKHMLANLLFRHLRVATIPLLVSARPSWLSVLAYHRVARAVEADYPFVDGNISVTAAEFDRQIRFVRERFSVVNFNQLAAALKEKRVPKRALIITFDDGYADNYDIAYRILKKHDATATIFLATEFIDSGEPLWFDRVAYLIKRMPDGVLSLGGGDHAFELDRDNRRQTQRAVQRILGHVPNGNRIEIVAELERHAGMAIAKSDLERVKPLTWEQVREMSDAGIEIGSHTAGHPYLARLSEDEMTSEMRESKNRIEQETGRPVRSIAYPAGSYDARVIDCARNCGYEFGVTYAHGVKKYSAGATHEIPRLHVESEVDFPLFVANLLLPMVFAR